MVVIILLCVSCGQICIVPTLLVISKKILKAFYNCMMIKRPFKVEPDKKKVMNKTNTATWINWTIDDEEERRECPIYLVGRLQAREMEGESKIDIFADIHFGQIDMKPCNKNPMHHTHTHTHPDWEKEHYQKRIPCAVRSQPNRRKKNILIVFSVKGILDFLILLNV